MDGRNMKWLWEGYASVMRIPRVSGYGSIAMRYEE